MISVVIPVYNVEKYLQICIDSVLSQTYKDIEIILVDDGSTDSSGIICDKYADKNNNIIVIHKKNAGLGMARNSALKAVKGDFVYFLDSDDYIEPDQIEIMYNAIIENNVDACFVGYIAVNDSGNVLGKRIYEDKVYKGESVRKDFFVKMSGSLPNKSDCIEWSASAQLYSMQLIRKHELKFCSERELISEDFVFNMDYLQYSEGVYTSSASKNYYRKNPDSLTHIYTYNKFEKYKNFYYYIEKRFKNVGYGQNALVRFQKNVLIVIKSSISQEISLKSPHNREKQHEIIYNICKDELTQKIIKQYPVKELGFTQKLFVFMVKNKMVTLLATLLKIIEHFESNSVW